jgi:hypothetical protein
MNPRFSWKAGDVSSGTLLLILTSQSLRGAEWSVCSSDSLYTVFDSTLTGQRTDIPGVLSSSNYFGTFCLEKTYWSQRLQSGSLGACSDLWTNTHCDCEVPYCGKCGSCDDSNTIQRHCDTRTAGIRLEVLGKPAWTSVRIDVMSHRRVPWLRQLVVGLLPRRPGSVHMGFVVDRVALGQVFRRGLQFSPVSIIPPWLSILI